MLTFLREAGAPVIPVLFLGLLTLVLAFTYARAPQRERLILVVGFGTLTLLFSVLGFFLGVQASASFAEAAAETDRWMFVVGVRESLNNLVAGLLLVIASAGTTTVGAYRHARSSQTSHENALSRV